MSKGTKDYLSIDWCSVLYEDHSSPTGLRWKIGPNNRIKAGTAAGGVLTAKKSGIQYLQVGCKGGSWYVHRVLWVMRNGSIDSNLEVDHIDGNSLNNKPENLRLISAVVNSRNQKRHITNNSGVTGIYFMTTKMNTYAVAHWTNLSGNLEQKYFSCKKLGLLEAFAGACACREQMLIELNNIGAGYSGRHGE